MPAHAANVSEYCAILTRSKLVPEAEVQALHQRWQADSKGTDADIESFKKFLVSRKFLTDYQAAMIQRGHADGYFIGGYVIQDRIGKGQSAGVYKAVHATGQIVALKVLPASRAKEPNVLNRFQREGRLLTQLDHPNAVRAFQVGVSGSLNYIVMEYIDGETLEEVLDRRKKLPADEAARLVQQALHGLQHLHEKRMIHRDLKPANLMVTPAGSDADDSTLNATVKILDIGIGREFFDEDSPDTQDLMLTTEGAILGTPDYLAPEQARDARSADIRADIYSLGCVLFHLIAGRPPFPDRNIMGQMIKHATEKMPNLSQFAANIPVGLQAVLDKMTAKKPEDRYATPGEAADALTPFLPEGATTASDSMILPGFKEYLKSESDQELPAMREPAAGTGGTNLLPPLSMRMSEVKKAKAEAAPAKPASPPPTAKPAPKSARLPDEIDVELVTWPPSFPSLPRTETDEQRSLLDLSRRDFIMIGVGAVGVLLALGIGYGLAKLLKPAPLTAPTSLTAEPPNN